MSHPPSAARDGNETLARMCLLGAQKCLSNMVRQPLSPVKMRRRNIRRECCRVCIFLRTAGCGFVIYEGVERYVWGRELIRFCANLYVFEMSALQVRLAFGLVE